MCYICSCMGITRIILSTMENVAFKNLSSYLHLTFYMLLKFPPSLQIFGTSFLPLFHSYSVKSHNPSFLQYFLLALFVFSVHLALGEECRLCPRFLPVPKVSCAQQQTLANKEKRWLAYFSARPSVLTLNRLADFLFAPLHFLFH